MASAAVVGAGRRAVGGVGSAGTCRDHWASKRRCWRWLGVRGWRGGGEARGKWWAELVGERGRWSGYAPTTLETSLMFGVCCFFRFFKVGRSSLSLQAVPLYFAQAYQVGRRYP